MSGALSRKGDGILMTVRFSRKRLMGALKAFGAISAVAATAIVLPMAGERLEAQEERAEWRALAEKSLAAEEHDVWDGGSVLLQSAALELDSASNSTLLLPTRNVAELQTFGADHLVNAQSAAREQRCLAEAIYYEARSENIYGQLAVAEVVVNRVGHRAYPETICGVVYQGSELSTGCQFTFTCDGSMETAPRGRGWDRAQRVAAHMTMGFARPVTRQATHYHTVQIDPYWSGSLVRTRTVGEHIFYRFPSRAERGLLEREA
jgi:hypothetical protein